MPRLTCVFLPLLFSFAASGENVRMGLTSIGGPPWADILHYNGKETVVTGIQYDIGEAIAKELGTGVDFKIFPRGRIGKELESGEADFACNYREAWVPGDHVWVPNLFENGLRIVWRPETKPMTKIEDLRKVPVGTIRSYSYAEVEAVLGEDFHRDDSEDTLTVFRRLLHRDFDYMLMNSKSLEYLRAPGFYAGKISPKSVEIVAYGTGCVISKKAKLGAERIKAAFEALQKRGVIKKILKSYGFEK